MLLPEVTIYEHEDEYCERYPLLRIVSFLNQVLVLGVLDLPGLLFFSTYTLLVLFWAEIYHQVSEISIAKLLLVKLHTYCTCSDSFISIVSRQEVYQRINSDLFLLQLTVWCMPYRYTASLSFTALFLVIKLFFK